MSKLTDLIEMTREIQKKMKSDGEAALKEAFAEFFAAHPEAKAIVWTQYAPNFNDGEACIFGVREFELKVYASKMAEDVRKVLAASGGDDDCESDGYGHGEQCVTSILSDFPPSTHDSSYNRVKRAGVEARRLTSGENSLIQDFNNLEKACGEIEDVLKMVLGEDAKIVATRKGFGIEEYEHD